MIRCFAAKTQAPFSDCRPHADLNQIGAASAPFMVPTQATALHRQTTPTDQRLI